MDGRNHPVQSNVLANTHPPHPSPCFHYQGLSRPLQRGRCPRGVGRRASSKVRPSVRSTRVSVLCDHVHTPVHTPVHKTCLHSLGSSWGAAIVPGVFGTFCSGTLPSWVALMTQPSRSNSLSFPARRHLSQRQAGPTSPTSKAAFSREWHWDSFHSAAIPCVPSD